MLIYEKDNKLNINFDNEISENPDLQIGKEGGKTEVLVDGQSSGGGLFVVHEVTVHTEGEVVVNTSRLDKTWDEIASASSTQMVVLVHQYSEYDGDTLLFSGSEFVPLYQIMYELDGDNNPMYAVNFMSSGTSYVTYDKHDYPESLPQSGVLPNPGVEEGPNNPLS